MNFERSDIREDYSVATSRCAHSVLVRGAYESRNVGTLFSSVASNFRGYALSLRRSQFNAVLQIKCAQRVFDGIAESDDAVLHIAAKQCHKNIALSQNFWASCCTGTVRVIGEILFHQQSILIGAVRLNIQRV